jgi:hypothetical protein
MSKRFSADDGLVRAKEFLNSVTRTFSLSSNRTTSSVNAFKEFWHHDAITAIAGLALLVSLFSLLASRRANALAASAQAEHGRIKDLRIEFCGLHFGGKKGGVSWERAPLPAEESAHTTKIAVYGGPDPLRIEQLVLQVIYTAGKFFCSRLILTVALSDTDLRVSGPDIPATIDAYHKVVWQLPELLIPTGVFRKRDWRFSVPPGIYMPTVNERLVLHLVADYGGRSYVGRDYRYGLVFSPLAREVRPIKGMSRFMADPDVPEHLKSLFAQWYLPTVGKASARTPQTSSSKRRRRRRSR